MGLRGDVNKNIHNAEIMLASMAKDIWRAMFDEDMGYITEKKARRRERQASHSPYINMFYLDSNLSYL